MLYNRVFRTVVAPTVANFNFSQGYVSGYDDYSTYAQYENVLNFDSSPASPLAPPAPYSSWSVLLQQSTDNSTWTDTTQTQTLSGTGQKMVLNPASYSANRYFRLQVVLLNPSTGVVEERFSTSSSSGLISDYLIEQYKVYGAVLGVTASTTSITGITAPSAANKAYLDIISFGGNGAASNGAVFGGGGGGGRIIGAYNLSVSSRTFNISVTSGASNYCSLEDSVGNYCRIRNGGNGSLGVAGLGSTSASDQINGITLTNSIDGPNASTTSGGGYSANFTPMVTPGPSTGPFSSVDTAQIAGYYGFGGNGVPTIYAGATPANGSGGNVTLRFVKG